MNKNKILITIIVGLAFVIAILAVSITQFGQPVKEGKYPSGRDTFQAFGNGRIQIVWKNSDSKCLYDCEYQKTLLDRVDLCIETKDTIIFEGLLDAKFFLVKYILEEDRIYSNEKSPINGDGALSLKIIPRFFISEASFS